MCFLTGCDVSMPTTCLVLAFHSIGPAGVNECNSWRPATILRGVQVKQSQNRCCIPTSFNQFRLWASLHSPDPYQDQSARSSRRLAKWREVGKETARGRLRKISVACGSALPRVGHVLSHHHPCRMARALGEVPVFLQTPSFQLHGYYGARNAKIGGKEGLYRFRSITRRLLLLSLIITPH